MEASDRLLLVGADLERGGELSQDYLSLSLYIYIYIYVHVCVCIYTYIHT